MSKMIPVRTVPDDLHAELVRRAERPGLSLTDYMQGILEREVSRPPWEEVFERAGVYTAFPDTMARYQVGARSSISWNSCSVRTTRSIPTGNCVGR